MQNYPLLQSHKNLRQTSGKDSVQVESFHDKVIVFIILRISFIAVAASG